jgi:hypothetical protein
MKWEVFGASSHYKRRAWMLGRSPHTTTPPNMSQSGGWLSGWRGKSAVEQGAASVPPAGAATAAAAAAPQQQHGTQQAAAQAAPGSSGDAASGSNGNTGGRRRWRQRLEQLAITAIRLLLAYEAVLVAAGCLLSPRAGEAGDAGRRQRGSGSDEEGGLDPADVLCDYFAGRRGARACCCDDVQVWRRLADTHTSARGCVPCRRRRPPARRCRRDGHPEAEQQAAAAGRGQPRDRGGGFVALLWSKHCARGVLWRQPQLPWLTARAGPCCAGRCRAGLCGAGGHGQGR